ncbi:MAG: hypothetical protein J6Y53_04350 [Alphaproteobacteria bacterium]|nr:hypothetical protein [Alphaproteobacteria bacterium]
MRYMKAVLLVFAALVLQACQGDRACKDYWDCVESAEDIVIATTPQNVKHVIFLVNQHTGDIACCQDTPEVSAEQCAQALEADCFRRIEDIPYGIAEKDFLKNGTYPTRRWREGETSPRW